jgi:hypothetical protein
VTTDNHNPRRGTRDNGLRAAGYQAVADLDPRLVDSLLAALREAGIAAYAEPTPGTTSGFMESVPQSRPVDRLSVDTTQVEQAKAILDKERETHEPERVDNLDFDQAWQDVLTSLRGPAATGPDPGWPAGDNVAAAADAESDVDLDELADDADDVHFEPPPPPPLPRFRKATLAALTSIGFGLLILATDLDDGSFTFLALAAIIGGLASLVWNMRQGPPTDSGWDDGAVV